MANTPNRNYPLMADNEGDKPQAVNDALMAIDEDVNNLSSINPFPLPDVSEPETTTNKLYSVATGVLKWAGKIIPLVASSLGNSQIVETDASGNLISAAKGTAYNKNFGTTSGTVAEGNHTHTAEDITDFADAVHAATESTSAAPVADITALRAVASADRADGQQRLVESTGNNYRFNAAGTGSDDGDGTITPGDITEPDPGRWFKISSSSTGDADTLDGQDGTYYLSRANHSGTQAQSTVTNLTTDLAAKQAVANLSTDMAADTGSNTKYPSVAAVEEYVATNGGAGAGHEYIQLRDEKTSGTSGGTFTSGSWQTRTLNVEKVDTGGNCTLSSNQFTLDAGTYEIEAWGGAYRASVHQLRIQNITDSTTAVLGQTAIATDSNNTFSTAILSGRFTIAASKTFELQHRGSTTQATNGFGIASGWGTEIYAEVVLRKVA